MRIAHVTLYPGKGQKHTSAGSGVAGYSKNLVTNIDAADQVVVCNMTDGKFQFYAEDDVEICRVFQRNPSFIFSVHKELKKLNPDIVHIQQELSLFGNILTAYLVQWLVLVWRKKVVITLHGIVDPRMIDASFVKENNSSLPAWIVKLAFRIIYTPLFWWADKIIVHEEYFRQIAIKKYGASADKLQVIPHGVEAFVPEIIYAARKKLRIPSSAQTVLFMGYATGYKGMDLLIDGFAEYAVAHKDALLIIGAGKHPKLRNDPKYLAEYARLQQKAEATIPTGQYRWIGFIDESETNVYYSASDVSLYPYTTAMSSSGPMSFAIGYEKPFLVSEAFSNIFDNYPQLIFRRNKTFLADKLEHFFSHYEAYADVSRQLKQQRSWQAVGTKTLQLYTQMNDQKGLYETEESITAG